MENEIDTLNFECNYNIYMIKNVVNTNFKSQFGKYLCFFVIEHCVKRNLIKIMPHFSEIEKLYFIQFN